MVTVGRLSNTNKAEHGIAGGLHCTISTYIRVLLWIGVAATLLGPVVDAQIETLPVRSLVENSGRGSAAVGSHITTIEINSEIEAGSLKETPTTGPPMMFEFDDAVFKELKRIANTTGARPSSGTAFETVVDETARDPRALTTDFAGIAHTGWIPPDPVLAAGPNHLMVCVNSSFAVYDKLGSRLYYTTFADWFSNMSIPGGAFDPKVIYDNLGGRWIMLALSRNESTQQSSYVICVSDDSDPIGSWDIWDLDATEDGSTPTTNWADYPGLGFDNDAIYLTSNQYAFGGNFQYAKLRILKKSELYTASGVTWYDYWLLPNADGSMAFTVKPAEAITAIDGAWLLNTRPSGDDYVTIWRVTNPTSSTPTLSRSATVSIGAYGIPPDADQPGTTIDIETNDCRTQDVVFCDGDLYTAFCVGHDWGSGTRAAIRYLKISTNDFSVPTNTNYGHADFDYYFPKATPNSNGQCETIVFNRSNANTFAGVRFVDNFAFNSSSTLLKAGEGSYVNVSGGRNRWGDYSGIWFDPSDNSIWVYGEYATTTTTRWGTWIGNVQCDPCDPLSSDFSGAPRSGCKSLQVCFDDLTTGNPTSWNWDFGDGGSSTAQHPCHTYSAAGSYTVSLSVSSACDSDSETKSNFIIVFGAPSGAPSNASATDDRCDGVEVTWSWSGSGHDGFHVYRDGILLPPPIPGPGDRQYLDATAAQGQTYSYTVAAFNGCGDGPVSGSDPGRREVTLTVAPTNCSATDDLPDKVIITWTWSGSNQDGFRVYRNGIALAPDVLAGARSFDDGTGDQGVQYTYLVRAFNNCGEGAASNSDAGTRPFALAADFVGAPTEGCAQLNVQFTDLSSGATSWSWDFGDDQYSTEPDPLHTYQQGGVYTVSLRVSDGVAADTMIRTDYITTREPAIASFVPSVVSGCVPLEVQFTNTSSGAIDASLWDFGDGITSTDYSPLHSYLDTGTFTVSLTVSNSNCPPDQHTEVGLITVDTCNSGSIAGTVRSCAQSLAVESVQVNLTGDTILADQSDVDGHYFFDGVASGSYTVTPSRTSDDDGVSVADIVNIARHILQTATFEDPCQLIACDVNETGTCSVADITNIARYILQIAPLPSNNWKFVDSAFALDLNNWPQAPEAIDLVTTGNEINGASFNGIRMGDVNSSWSSTWAISTKPREVHSLSSPVTLQIPEMTEMTSPRIIVPVVASGEGLVSGYEVHLKYAPEVLRLVDAVFPCCNFVQSSMEPGRLRAVWYDVEKPAELTSDPVLVQLEFEKMPGSSDSAAIEIIGAELVSSEGQPYLLSIEGGTVVWGSPLDVSTGDDEPLLPSSVTLEQNYPNPFNVQTAISFYLPIADRIDLSIYNVLGQRIRSLTTGTLSAGRHNVIWDGFDDQHHLTSSGTYFYVLESSDETLVRKMILIK